MKGKTYLCGLGPEYIICFSLKPSMHLREECFRNPLTLKCEVLVQIELKWLVGYGIYSHRRFGCGSWVVFQRGWVPALPSRTLWWWSGPQLCCSVGCSQSRGHRALEMWLLPLRNWIFRFIDFLIDIKIATCNQWLSYGTVEGNGRIK